jgi:hypothetical protein
MLVSEELWGDTLDAARVSGVLSPDLSNREILEWLMGIHYLLIVRKGATGDDLAGCFLLVRVNVHAAYSLLRKATLSIFPTGVFGRG